MKVLENKAQIEALEAMSELQNARQRGTEASRGAEEVLTRLSHPMDISDNIRPRKASKQVHRGLAKTNCVASVCVCVTLHFLFVITVESILFVGDNVRGLSKFCWLVGT